MFYQLFDHVGKNVTHHDLQDKGVWCLAGASKEEAFVQIYGATLGLAINPAKTHSPYVPDLLNTHNGALGDLKTQNTPFFQARSRFGLDPQYAVVFNGKDRERYRRLYPNIEIYFAVDWQVVRFESSRTTICVEPMLGVWFVPFPVLDVLLETAPFHAYQQREGDTKGNAKGSYVLDLQAKGFERVV